MAPKAVNVLIETSKKIPNELDDFIVRWDKAEDKAAHMLTLGDVMALRFEDLDYFARMTYALGINTQTDEEAEVYLRMYHSNQTGANQSSNNRRIDAMINFLTVKYVDVSRYYIVEIAIYSLVCKLLCSFVTVIKNSHVYVGTS